MSEAEHVQVKVSVLGFLSDGNKILFQRRYNTGWEDGKYTIPSGRIHEGELPIAAMIRELEEEIGVTAKPKDVEFVYFDYVQDKYVNIFFRINAWEGTPKIMEHDKCDELKWIDLNDLPDNLVGRGKQILEDIQKGVKYAEYDDF